MPTRESTRYAGRGHRAEAGARALARARKRTASAVQHAAVVPAGYNFHTHIGRPVLDRDGHEIRIGKGKSTRVRVEYVPIFADAAATARVMVRAAARKAWLDARRAAKADRTAATEARRVVRRAMAKAAREVRATRAVTRRTLAVTAGSRAWTLPKWMRGRAA